MVIARVERDAQQHHLHPEHRRDAEPPDAGASLGLDDRLLRVHGIGGGAVSGPGQCFEQDMQARGARVEPHLGSPQREVDGGGVHPRSRREQALDQPRASGAAHPLHREGDGARAVRAPPGLVAAMAVTAAGAPHHGRLDLGDPPCVQLRPVAGVGGGCALRVRVGAQPVPGIKPGVRDGLDRGTAGVAAYLRLAPRHHDLARAAAERRPAVMAAGRRGLADRRKEVRAQRFLPVRSRRAGSYAPRHRPAPVAALDVRDPSLRRTHGAPPGCQGRLPDHRAERLSAGSPLRSPRGRHAGRYERRGIRRTRKGPAQPRAAAITRRSGSGRSTEPCRRGG